MGARPGVFVYVSEIPAVAGCVVGCFASKHCVAGRRRYSVEVAADYRGETRLDLRQLVHDDAGAARLDLRDEIEMGIHANQLAGSLLKLSDGALAWPSAVTIPAGDRRCRAQEEMPAAAAFPAAVEKDNVVLPKRRRRFSLAYMTVIGQQFFQKINLECIGFLNADKVGFVLCQQLWKSGFSDR